MNKNYNKTIKMCECDRCFELYDKRGLLETSDKQLYCVYCLGETNFRLDERDINDMIDWYENNDFESLQYFWNMNNLKEVIW